MKVEVSSRELFAGLKMIAALFSGKADGECLLTAKKDVGLILECGSDGAYIKRVLSDATVFVEGEVAIKGAYLSTLRLADKVTLESTKPRLKFTSGRLQGELETSQAINFFKQQRPTKEIDTPISIAKEDFAAVTRRVFFAPSLSSNTFCLRLQIVDEGDDSYLVMSSADSFRAALCKRKLAAKTPNIDVAVSPAFLWNFLSKIGPCPLLVGTSRNAIRIYGKGIDVYHPLVVAELVDIEAWIRQLGDTEEGKVKFDVVNTLEAISQASSVRAGVSSHEIRLRCSFKDKLMRMLVQAPNGEAKSEAELVEGVDKELNVTWSSKFVTELLGLIGDGLVEVKVWNTPPAVVMHSELYNASYVMSQIES